MEKISIIVPCRNEGKYISDFLKSILDNVYPKESMEILIIDGKSTDNTITIIERFMKNNSIIKLLINENRTVPYALNMGIKVSTGDYIIRLDAHSEIPKNYFSELINWAEKLKTDNIGTICITDVKNKNTKSIAIKKVLSNKFGVGNSYFRIGINELKEVDTVPFGCYKKEVFREIGLFNENLERNQDIELNKRIKRNGGRIILLHQIHCTYFARETYSALAGNNYATGLWNILTVYITKNFGSLSLRHFIPLLFLLSITLPLIISFWIPYFALISGVTFFSYICLISVVSFRINDKSTSFINIFIAFITLHFSYGFGSLIGLFDFKKLLNRKKT